MCGICGFVNHSDDQLLKKMTKLMGHRGPNAEGLYSSSDVSLGHRRLSIIDLSAKGKQPMSSENGSVLLVFNGEIFNFQEIREELRKLGHYFKSKTDTEVVVHGYEEWGIEKIVKKLRGFFAFALWDKKIKVLYLVRDRIGVKPLYYYQEKEKLFFASEIKAILENSRIPRKVNLDAFNQYLAFQASLGEETLFSGIKKVPPATILSFKNGNINHRQYWSLNENPSIHSLNRREKEDRFFELLKESVKIRLLADVPLGILLSGGLDSSSLVALTSLVYKDKIKTFSVGFGQKDDELKYAKIIAERFQTDHQELIIQPKAIQEVLEKIVWHQDEPLADGGGIATFLTAQAVSRKVKVVLIGEGGDELFGGYSWYKLGLPILNFLPEKIKESAYFYLTTFYREKNQENSDQYLKFRKLFSSYPGDFLQKMIRFEIENILPNSLCMKVDKMTSAWGLEAREPFLDHNLAEFCFSLNQKDRISLNQSKVLLRKVMTNLLPKEILARKKHGFLLPTEKWLNEDLNVFTRETLLSKNSFTMELYPKKEIEKLFLKRRLFEEIERVSFLWRLLIFELWYSIYFVKNLFE